MGLFGKTAGRAIKKYEDKRGDEERDADKLLAHGTVTPRDAAHSKEVIEEHPPKRGWFGFGNKNKPSDLKKMPMAGGSPLKSAGSALPADSIDGVHEQNENLKRLHDDVVNKQGTTNVFVGKKKNILESLHESGLVLPAEKCFHLHGQLQRWWILESLDHELALDLDDQRLGQEDSVETSGSSLQKLPPFMFHPNSRQRAVWDTVIAFILIYNMLMIPFRLGLLETQVGYYCQPTDSGLGVVCPGRLWLEFWNTGFWFYFDFSTDVFFLLDIVLNFLTTYQHSNPRGDLVYELRRGIIAWKYFVGWFPFDFITSVPVEAILYYIGNEESKQSAAYKIVKLARLLKLFRLWRLGVIIQKVREALDLHPAFVRMFQLFSVFTMITHWLACFMFWSGSFYDYYLTCIDDDPECICWLDDPDVKSYCKPTTWLMSKSFVFPGQGEQLVGNVDVDMQYLVSVYWTITTMSTVGYGDISPVAFTEFMACVVMQVVGASTFGFLVGNMGTLATLMEGRSGQLKEEIKNITTFLSSFDVPKVLQKRVVQDIQHFYKTPNVIIKKEIIDAVPSKLAADVAKSVFLRCLDRTPIFDGIQKSAKHSLYLRLKPFQVAQGDVIFNPGEVSRMLIFVLSGSLSILRTGLQTASGLKVDESDEPTDSEGRSLSPLLVTLTEGAFTGEMCLLAGRDTCDYCVIASTWSDLVSLDVRDIVDSLWEDDLRRVRLAARIIHERMSAMIVLSSKVRPEMSMFLQPTDHNASFKPPTSAFGKTFKKNTFITPSSKSLVESKLIPNESLKTLVNTIDLTSRQKQFLLEQIDKAFATGKAPQWSGILNSRSMQLEIDRLTRHHGSLADAEKQLCDKLPPDVFCTLNLGLSDEFGKDLKPQLEMQLSSILRRLRQTIALAQQFDGRSARVGAEGEDESSKHESSRRLSTKRIHKDGSITVFKVKVLKMADFAEYSGFMDKTDPLVTLTLDGNSCSTKVVKDAGGSATFNEILTLIHKNFAFDRGGIMLKVEVLDWDAVGEHDALGEALIQMNKQRFVQTAQELETATYGQLFTLYKSETGERAGNVELAFFQMDCEEKDLDLIEGLRPASAGSRPRSRTASRGSARAGTVPL